MTRIVTDSSSDISPRLAAELGITILPMRIRFGTETYYDGVDISRADFYRYWAKRTGRPTAEPPTVEEFQQAYRRLLSSNDQVLSIHVSSSLSSTARVARNATKAFLGQGKITVIDSRVISWGLEILVTFAAEAAKRGASVEDIVRLIRGVIPHIYMVFHVEDLDSAEGRRYRGMKRLSSESFPGPRPLLILEDGELMPMERGRSRGTLTERLFEFVAEFARFDRATILQGRLANGAQSLFEHLIDAFPEKRLDVKPYGLVLATHLGPDALGVCVYEGR
ncbi:MAG: DegV family protein [Anaerolineales bacterium]|jgi:DegV family protein with EDD domain|nr:MAG: DegV family protein [Anaerolineales bacterium]